MKKLLFLLLLIPFLGNSQATFTAPVGYNTGAPTATPSGVGTRWRFDLLTGKKYTWLPGSLSWDEDARGIDQVAGCSAPLYTPGYNQSTFAVNSCTVPELYQWTGAAWVRLNEGEVYTAGTGISIDGSNVITNTSPNVVQTLSIAGQDLTLSGGGGTVAIPGVSWPLLAPDGTVSAPSYSFANSGGTGMYFGGGGLALVAGDQLGFTMQAGSGVNGGTCSAYSGNTSEDEVSGGGFTLQAGNATGADASGGGLSIIAGNGLGTSNAGGTVFIQGGQGTAQGGGVQIFGGNGPTDATDGKIEMFGAGAVLPKLTTAQRNALSGVVSGTTIYNTDATATDASTGVMQVYNGSAWKNAW